MNRTDFQALVTYWSSASQTETLIRAINSQAVNADGSLWRGWLDRVRDHLRLYRFANGDDRVIARLVAFDELTTLAAQVEQDSIVAEALSERLSGKARTSARSVRDNLDRLTGMIAEARGTAE